MSKTLMHRVLALVSAATAGVLVLPPAHAYPERPLRLIVPFAPGGGTDILGRLIAQGLTEGLGQQVIADNRPGAGGNVGAELAARATSDGYNLVIVSASYAVNAAVYKLSFDPVKDLTPVIQVASVPFVLLAHPSVPASNVQELLALAKKQPGKLNYASSGSGSSPHLAGELLGMRTGVKLVHVPYKGGAPALRDLMGGQVQLLFLTAVAAIPQVQAGRVKALAVGSLERSSALPNVPTIAESGVPGYDVTNWFGILVPAGTPADRIGRLNREINKVLDGVTLKQTLANQGATPVGGSAADFAKVIRDDIAKYKDIVKAAKIQVR
ncbi:MAG: tripartite tricarboxylate transporter substrate binding protein [Betaproteobacteria bacterium]|nr:tripartite tricarboxylate transporter substrate binding protein [Betaproteobacteria bacterium]